MQSSQLNKALNIMRRTGDRLILMDKESEEAVVLMSLDSYERMLGATQAIGGLSEGEMVDKINRDIAVWRAHNESGVLNWYDGGLSKRPSASPGHNDFMPADNFAVGDDDWPEDDDENDDMDFDRVGPRTTNFSDKWDVSEGEEESLEDVPAQEPQFYMEPIE